MDCQETKKLICWSRVQRVVDQGISKGVVDRAFTWLYFDHFADLMTLHFYSLLFLRHQYLNHPLKNLVFILAVFFAILFTDSFSFYSSSKRSLGLCLLHLN